MTSVIESLRELLTPSPVVTDLSDCRDLVNAAFGSREISGSHILARLLQAKLVAYSDIQNAIQAEVSHRAALNGPTCPSNPSQSGENQGSEK